MAAPATITPPAPHRSHPGLRVLLSVIVVALALGFVWTSRRDLPDAGHALIHARRGLLALLAALSGLYLLAYSGLVWSSLRAAGLSLPFRRAALLATAAHFYNTVIPNSGGLGGLPVYLREAQLRGKPRSAAVTGALAVSQLGHLLFAGVLAIALVSAFFIGELTRVELVAAALFAAYTFASLIVLIAAASNERAFRTMYGLPQRLLTWARKRTGRRTASAETVSEADNAGDIYASVQVLIRSPKAWLLPLLFAVAIEALGVVMVWSAVAAFGPNVRLATALIAYCAGVLLSTVGFLPAGLGFAEVGLGVALSAGGVAAPQVALAVITYRVFEAWVPFGVGAGCAHALGGRNLPAIAPPGLRGGNLRRLAAAAAFGLGVFNVFLAARRHPLIRVGPFHELIPHAAVQSSRYLLLATGIALLGSATGLLHGKRQAWAIAIAAIVLALVAHPFKRVDYVGILANATVLSLLIALTPAFPARSDPARARQGLVWLLLGEFGVLVYGVTGLYLLDRHFAGSNSFFDVVEDGARLLFVLPSTTIEPTTRHGAWFIDSVRVAAMAVLVVAGYHLLHPVIHRHTALREERRAVSRLLERYATTSIAFFHSLPDKSYFFATGGEAFIGYRVVGHTAVALGEPIGAAGARRQVLNEFAEFCDLNGWTFCFHQVAEVGATELTKAGLQALKIGEEAVIPVQEFSLAGKSFKHIRNAVNRLEREGFRVELQPAPLPPALIEELEAVSDEWLRSGGHRERAFTLGAFSRDYVRGTDVILVRSPEARVEAFANLIPSYHSRDGNFDLMRRRTDSPDGVMDFLFVAMIEHFKNLGMVGMNLGFAPLANISGGGVAGAALRLLYARGSAAFNFHGLRTFKQKWKPDWQPRYLVYRSDLQLPAIALAVARAGERSGSLRSIVSRPPAGPRIAAEGAAE